MTLTVLNDVHAGAIRSAGTTPVSQWLLRKHIVESFKRLLPYSGDLLLNGDTFDSGNVPIHDVLQIFEVLADWLHDHKTSKLYNSAGNHDLSKTSTVLSSFQFLGALLSRQFPDRYVHIEQPTMTPHGYVIPHLRNQDMFDLALEAVPACDVVYIHANYDNGFAAESDQSLNVSKEQAEALPCKHVIFGHEHHARTLGKVIITGNQIASSVSDWLSPGDKRFAIVQGSKVDLHVSARRCEEFIEVGWKHLATVTDKKFIRVSGMATADEISNAVTALNRFRAASEALVVTNAIETQTDEGVAEVFSSSLDSVQAFDIMEALRKIFTAEEMAKLESVQ